MELWKQLKTPVLAFVGVMVFVFLLLFLLSGNSGGTVTINTENGATISVATARGEPFSVIGTTSASYSTSEDRAVYIQVDMDGNATQWSTNLVGGVSVEKTLSLRDAVEPKRLFGGSLKDLFIEDDVAYGIEGRENRLDSFGISKTVPINPEFIGLDRLEKVVWQDADNFIYRSIVSGLGKIENGKNTRQDNIGKTVLEGSRQVEFNSIFFDATLHPRKDLVALAPTGIYTSSDFGKTMKFVLDSPNGKSVENIYSDADYIYLVSTTFDELDSADGHEHITERFLLISTYDGNIVLETQIDSGEVEGIAGNGSNIYLLGDAGIQVLNIDTQSQPQNLQLHQLNLDDLLVVDGTILFMTESGVWLFNESDTTLSLVSGIPDGEEGHAGSLVRQGSSRELYFGTNFTDIDGRPGYTYSINLSQ